MGQPEAPPWSLQRPAALFCSAAINTELRDAHGVPMGGFDQIIMIYAVGEALHADYTDGRHVILYTEAKIDPGRSVVFTSSAEGGVARFRLTYTVDGPSTLAVDFAMTPQGQGQLPVRRHGPPASGGDDWRALSGGSPGRTSNLRPGG